MLQKRKEKGVLSFVSALYFQYICNVIPRILSNGAGKNASAERAESGNMKQTYMKDMKKNIFETVADVLKTNEKYKAEDVKL